MKKQYLKYLIKYFLLLFCTFSSSKEEKNNKELNIYIHGFGAGGNNNITDVSNCKLNQDKYYDEIKYFDYPDSDIFKLSRKNRTESGKKLYNLLINEEIQKIKNMFTHTGLKF